MRDHPDVDRSGIQAAFNDIFDQAIVFHGFADYMRDYEVFIYATADPRTGITPEHLRYRFTHCVRATVTSALSPPRPGRLCMGRQVAGALPRDEARAGLNRRPAMVR